MKLIALFFLTLLLLGSCASSDKQDAAHEQQAVADSDTTKIFASADMPAQDTLKTQLYTKQADVSGLTLKTGQLNYTGNEPFAVPAIFVNGNETYKLEGDKTFMNETFKTINGKQVSLYGKVKKKDPHTIFEVHYYEITGNK